MKRIIFKEDWQGYKKGSELEVSEENAIKLVDVHNCADYKKPKKEKK